jgi:lipoprotein NlpI
VVLVVVVVILIVVLLVVRLIRVHKVGIAEHTDLDLQVVMVQERVLTTLEAEVVLVQLEQVLLVVVLVMGEQEKICLLFLGQQ